MLQFQNSSWFKRFSRHLVIAGGVYYQRKKAKDELELFLQKMRKSIMRMTLSYSDIDKLSQKIDNLIDWERRYSRMFKPEDSEIKELKEEIRHLENELMDAHESKSKMHAEHTEKTQQLTQSLENIKGQLKNLHLEKAKRHHRLKALEEKISGKIDVHSYYHS
jgi:DNA repair exonuclease SbcCD ATPase subunit